jgi:hypothetical protein
LIWVVVGAIVAALAAAILYWWFRRRRQHRLISIVGLLREPMTFDPVVLASVAGKAWDADLGDGTTDGADGSVVCAGVMNTIIHRYRVFLINSFPRPYTENVEADSEGIADRRIRSLFREHQAWFSCDVLGLDSRSSQEELIDLYQRLGKLFAALLDENCLLIFLPDSGRAYPINEDTVTALKSDDPVNALQATLTVPIIEVSDDDPLMKRAVAKARQEWPKFVAAYEARAGENFSVKAPLTYRDNTEYIWICVTSIEGERIYGELGNEPARLGSL